MTVKAEAWCKWNTVYSLRGVRQVGSQFLEKIEGLRILRRDDQFPVGPDAHLHRVGGCDAGCFSTVATPASAVASRCRSVNRTIVPLDGAAVVFDGAGKSASGFDRGVSAFCLFEAGSGVESGFGASSGHSARIFLSKSAVSCGSPPSIVNRLILSPLPFAGNSPSFASRSFTC